MKRKFLVATLIASTFLACNNEGDKKVTTDTVKINETAGEATSNEAKPTMKFESELFDFGTITQGEKASFSYTFTNEGETDLIITSAKGSCGCTVPEWPKQPIAPGQSGKIDVVFNSTGKSGKQHKKVTIVANTMPATNVVALTGEVIVPEAK